MATEKQMIANALNAQHSTGPRSDAGKARSSQNARKHGLCGVDVALPNEDPELFDQRMAQWHDFYASDDPGQAALARGAALADWRLVRCARAERSRLAGQVRHAVDLFDAAQHARAEEVGKRLVHDPLNRVSPQTKDPLVIEKLAAWHEDDPPLLAAELDTFARGAQWKIDRWDELARTLCTEGYWHYPQKFEAIRLLGKRSQDALCDQQLQEIFLACNAAHPDKWDLWDEFHQARLGCDGKPTYVMRVEFLRKFMPEHDDAQRYLLKVADDEIARLKQLGDEHLLPLEEADRAGACDGAMLDETPAGQLLRRYETANARELHRSLRELRAGKKAGNAVSGTVTSGPERVVTAEAAPSASPARNEPNSGSGLGAVPSLEAAENRPGPVPAGAA
jgi:hypothetical protein